MRGVTVSTNRYLFSVIQREIEADVLNKEYVIPITQIVDWPVESQSEKPKIIVLVYRFAFKRGDRYVYAFQGAQIR